MSYKAIHIYATKRRARRYMPPKGELVGTNPQHISQATVDGVFSRLSGDLSTDLSTLVADVINEPYVDIFTEIFQVFRMKNLGWRIELSDQDREHWQTEVEAIESDGPESSDRPETVNFFTGASLMRTVVVTAFKAEAEKQRMPAPDIHSDRIDIPVIPNDLVDVAYATETGKMYGVTEELLDWWQSENPELYDSITQLREKLADQFTQDTQILYEGLLPNGFEPKLLADIQERWEAHLAEVAVRAYMWFTPSSPPLHELRVKS